MYSNRCSSSFDASGASGSDMSATTGSPDLPNLGKNAEAPVALDELKSASARLDSYGRNSDQLVATQFSYIWEWCQPHSSALLPQFHAGHNVLSKLSPNPWRHLSPRVPVP